MVFIWLSAFVHIIPFPKVSIAGYLAQLSANSIINIDHFDISGGGGNRAFLSLLATMSLLFFLLNYSVGAIFGP